MSTRAVVGLLLAVAGMSTTRDSSACERDDAAFNRCAPTAWLASPCSESKISLVYMMPSTPSRCHVAESGTSLPLVCCLQAVASWESQIRPAACCRARHLACCLCLCWAASACNLP